MLFLPEFPWSDLHTLNLDWLLSVVAAMKRQVDDLGAVSTPSESEPLMDGTASPGVENEFSRGDHRHPTDTTRASVAALQAVQDSVPGPSNGLPKMDGNAYSGFYNNYSRADHVHPSDTSKLDKRGGEVDGLLDIVPRRCYGSLSNAGWYRVLTVASQGRAARSWMIDLNITRAYGVDNNEAHSVKLMGAFDSFAFVDENSRTNTLGIDKIRYTTNGSTGYVDIHYSLASENIVGVDFNVHVLQDTQGNFTANSLESVDDSPNEETIRAEHAFTMYVSAARNIDMITSLGTALASGIDLNNITTPGKYYLVNGANTIGNLPYAGTELGYFDLIVMPRSSISRMWQILMDGQNGNIYQRRMTGAGTWSAWAQL